MPFWFSQRSFRGILTEFDQSCVLRLERGLRMGWGGGRDKKTSVLFKSMISRLRLCIAFRVAPMYPAGILRFCPPGLAVALILGILSPLARPPFQPSLAPCLLLSLSLSPTLPPFAAVFLFPPRPSWYLATPTRWP